METAAFPQQSGTEDTGTCGILGQIDDERLQLMGLIVRSHRNLTDQLGRELERTVGIPMVWFDVLIHIGGAAEGRLTMSKLSSDVALTTGGVTRLVDRMVEAGLVARENCPNDRRSVHVVLTPSGRDTLGQAIAEQIEGIDRLVFTQLSVADRAALTGTLSKLVGDC
ncbi:MAG TPA: MarR family transcriptional regulator [Acidimicrobiales bacterium]|jgi:DNA-binding MarR family transcriptional regulator|nr:MarR family transcriptional regulator [Acidimicrobiales bacterium]